MQSVNDKMTNQASDYLIGRGVKSEIESLGWQWQTGGFWEYVIDDGIGKRARRRALAAFANGAKVIWAGGNGTYAPALYYAPDAAAAIRAADGVLWLAAGEMDLATYQAAGVRNVAALLGEMNTGRLADYLARLGVRHVNYYPDADETGRKSGRRVFDVCERVGVTASVYDLSEIAPAKGDVNDVWIASAFIRREFWRRLAALDLLDLPPAPGASRQHHAAAPTYDGESWPPAFVDAVIAALMRQPKARQNGGEILSCSPMRDNDSNPSFSFNVEKLTGYDHTTGAGVGVVALGAAMGVNIQDYRPTRQRSTRRGNLDAMPDATDAGGDDRAGAALDAASRRYNPDVTVNGRYLTDCEIPDAATVAIKSALGTGKTEFVKRRYFQRGRTPRRVLAITHLQTLSGDIAARLSTDHYSQFTGGFSGAAAGMERLTITLNSLHKLADARPYDVVFVDEIIQALAHLYSGTFGAGDDAKAFETLCKIIREARQVIIADAHMTDAAAAFVSGLRGGVLKVENTYKPQGGNHVTLYETQAAMIERANEVIATDAGTVVIATNSRKEAESLENYFMWLGLAVMCVHGQNAFETDKADFIRNINTRLSDYNVVIVSPTLGTGIDIQAGAAAVFGSFVSHHLASNDMLQMMMRFRNADERGAFVSHGARDGVPPSSDDLLDKHRRRAAMTAQYVDLQAAGVTNVTAAQGEMMRLWAMIEADALALKHDLRGTFCYLAAMEGFAIRFDTRPRPDDLAAALAESRKDTEAWRDSWRLTMNSITPDEIDALRTGGALRRDDFFGLDRYTIETATGTAITPELLAEYKHANNRRALARFAVWTTGTAAERDVRDTRLLPMKREHHTLHEVFFNNFLAAVWGKRGLSSDERISADTLAERLAVFLTNDENRRIVRALDGRDDLSEEPIAVARRILKRFGLDLSSEQSAAKINGRRQMIYWISARRRLLMFDRARVLASFWARIDDAKSAGKPIDLRDFIAAPTSRPPLPDKVAAKVATHATHAPAPPPM